VCFWCFFDGKVFSLSNGLGAGQLVQWTAGGQLGQWTTRTMKKKGVSENS